MAGGEPIKNFSGEDIRRYHAGELSPQERHALEKAALDDPFLADALEGYAYTVTPDADLAELRQRLQQKREEEKVIPPGRSAAQPFRWWRIAALFLLLVGAGWAVVWFMQTENRDVAFTQEQSKADSIASAPTAVPEAAAKDAAPKEGNTGNTSVAANNPPLPKPLS